MNNPLHNQRGCGQSAALKKNLSPLHVWALAFGCIIGGSAFFMPANTFLPAAGPLGTAIAMLAAAGVMILIAFNYHYMVNKLPEAGGEFAYARSAFGRRHAFICSWFLCLSYVALVPLNATLLGVVGRYLLGDLFQTGYLYSVAGYEVYAGEVLLAVGTLLLFALLNVRGIRITGCLQLLLSAALIAGVAVIALAALASPSVSFRSLQPLFPSENSILPGILAVMAISPWAFVGFDTVPQTAEEFAFPTVKTRWIMVISILFGAVVYITLNTVTAAAVPQGYPDWMAYVNDVRNLSGLQSLPTFHAAKQLLGSGGLFFIGIAVVAAALAGVVGFYVAASRLLFSMAREKTALPKVPMEKFLMNREKDRIGNLSGATRRVTTENAPIRNFREAQKEPARLLAVPSENVLPKWFRTLHPRYATPVHAVWFVFGIAFLAPFFGRTVLGWVVDMSSIGAAIGFSYTSAATVHYARRERRRGMFLSGVIGTAFSLLFVLLLLIPVPGVHCSLTGEEYTALALWSGLGALFYAFSHRRNR